MTWTSVSDASTSWNEGDGINEGTTLVYNNPLPYNIDYMTYNGDYVEANTDWSAQSDADTSWASA